ncbi:SDR family oxidoreductase [Granulosicoccus sp.]|nr:SDR family oxidoreductase [Granulosicoccus sp.]MDB4223506.1 SDR family oxidoreductase [Granulosicoccus sp.]
MISFSLTGKRALVTGAASGIGLATATLLAKSGASVALNDLPHNEKLEAEVQRLTAEGCDVIAAPGNVGDAASAAEFVARAISDLGGLDYLVNNAGTPGTSKPIPPSDFTVQNEEFWQKLLSINLQGPYRCTAAAIEALSDSSSAAIVNTASTAGIIGNGSSAVYAATKAGLIALTKEHARAFGPDIRVNAIAPGIVDSEWECRFDISPDTFASLPMRRPGRPEDFAEAIVYLLAGAAYITGQVIVVDGGLLAGPIA